MQQIGLTKWIVMAGLLAAAILVTVYFHLGLGSTTLFTHLFYIPIILGALWWGWRGISVALFLVCLLMVSHWMYLPERVVVDDFFRAGMFVVVAWVVVLLRAKIKAVEVVLRKQTLELASRVRALSCIYAINKLRDKPDLSLDDIFLATEKLLQEALHNETSGIVCIQRNEHPMDPKGSPQEAARLAVPITADAKPVGYIQVSWAGGYEPDANTLESARQLIATVGKRLGKITEHENARVELAQYRAHLEDLVQDRTEELIAVNRRLREEILEREKADSALRESEKHYRTLFENAEEAIFIAQDRLIRFPNPALMALTGQGLDYLLQTPFLELIHPDDRAMVAERYQQRLSGEAVPHSYTFRIMRADNRIRWVEINTVVIQWQGRPGTLNFLRDITARRKMEASIIQVRKMEAIGALAGGIAHKFNNALSGITGNIDLLKLTVPDNPNVQRYSEAMFQSAQTMTGLTQQLLAYARGGKYQSQKYSLSVLVKDVLLHVATTDEKKIRFETALSPDTPMVEADPVQMRMVMLAVIQNAVEAIEQTGKIRIEAFRARFDQAAAEAFAGLPAGQYAGLSIIDNGKGMPEEVRERMFEPFFTTKFLGRGLGMAAAYGIIKNHGGYIYVDSELGRGTVVHILLPPSAKEVRKNAD